MEERTHGAKYDRRQKRLRWAAIILGLIGAGAGIPWSFVACWANFQSQFSLAVGYLGFSGLIHWATWGIALAWSLVGGALLIIDGSLVLMFLFLEHLIGLRDVSLPNEWWMFLLFISLLLLASGALFILSRGEKRKHGEV